MSSKRIFPVPCSLSDFTRAAWAVLLVTYGVTWLGHHCWETLGRAMAVVLALYHFSWISYICGGYIIALYRARRERDSHKKHDDGEGGDGGSGYVSEAELPFVSLIVPARNEALVLRRLVESVSQVDYPAERFEMIVVNDHSTDNSREVLDDICRDRQFATFVKAVHRYGDDTGGGKSGSMNAGYPSLASRKQVEAAGATMHVVGYLDGDAVVDPSVLQKVALAFVTQPNLGGLQVPKCINTTHCHGVLGYYQFWEMIFDSAYHQWTSSVGGFCDLHGNGQFVRREALEFMGGERAWNECSITDDLDMTLKLFIADWDVRWWLHEFLIFEEPVTTWSALFAQRRRWCYGGYSRFLDYWRYIVRPDAKKRWWRFSSLCQFAVSFVNMLQSSADLVFSMSYGTPRMLQYARLSALYQFVMSIVCFWGPGVRQIRKQPSWKSPVLSLLQALLVLSTVWPFIMLWSLLEAALRPRSLAYEKSERIAALKSASDKKKHNNNKKKKSEQDGADEDEDDDDKKDEQALADDEIKGHDAAAMQPATVWARHKQEIYGVLLIGAMAATLFFNGLQRVPFM